MCQLHMSLTRTAQIYLELYFCVELHTKKTCCIIKTLVQVQQQRQQRSLCHAKLQVNCLSNLGLSIP